MNKKKLSEITSKIKNEIKNIDIVLPELYKDIFNQQLLENECTLMDNIDYATEMALYKINKIRENTEKSVIEFEKKIDKSLIAIENKNSKDLENIQHEILILKEQLLIISEEIYLDELTQIKNRKWLFNIYLKDKIFKSKGTLVFIDLNRFKEINDTYGHLAGDKTLKVFSTVLKSLENVNPVRYAGDEFLLLSSLNKIKIEKIIKSLVKYFDNKELKLNEKDKIQIKFSFGVSEFSQGENFEDIIEKADKYMYQNKK